MRIRNLLFGAVATMFGLAVTPDDAVPSIQQSTGAGSSEAPLDLQDTELQDTERELGSALRAAPEVQVTPRLAATTRALQAVREQHATGFGLSSWDETVLSAFAEDLSQSLGARSAPTLAQLLAALPERERTWLVVHWALSPRDLNTYVMLGPGMPPGPVCYRIGFKVQQTHQGGICPARRFGGKHRIHNRIDAVPALRIHIFCPPCRQRFPCRYGDRIGQAVQHHRVVVFAFRVRCDSPAIDNITAI